jgi:CMP-N,N'-diacetyllegionaminic acid synthase
MYKGKSVIALIPARGGSKGLPGKNIRPLCGKPLIAWSILRGLESSIVDCVCVTTDSEEIAVVARQAGAEVPFLRPTNLAADKSPTLPAVEHALDFYSAQGRDFDYLILLEPTSPLRHPGDIDAMLAKLIDHADNFDSLISIGEIAEHPSIIKRKDGDCLSPYCPELTQTTRRQDNPPAYFPYGVGYAVKTGSLREEQSFYTKRGTYYEIRRYQNYEIDDLQDFFCVEAIMKNEWKLS